MLDEGEEMERKTQGRSEAQFLKEWLHHRKTHSELELDAVSQLLPLPDTESESRKGHENAEFKDHVLNTRKERPERLSDFFKVTAFFRLPEQLPVHSSLLLDWTSKCHGPVKREL